MLDKIIQREFGIEPVEIKELDGYDNKNYKVSTADAVYIFKTYQFSREQLDLIKAENDLLMYLKAVGQNGIPEPISFTDNSYERVVTVKNNMLIIRMLSFLKGNFIGEATFTTELAASLGRFLAELDSKLINYTNYVLKSRQHDWDLQYALRNREYLSAIENTNNRSVVEYFFLQFEEIVVPALPSLRKSIIHNDANEWNLLTEDNKISGIIDFGDVAYTPLINELAIAITYACYNKESSTEFALSLLKAYHDISPLQEQEINILYYLIAARLCVSVCNSARAKQVNPENTYVTISEQYAWKFLHHLLTINPIGFENKVRAELGFEVNKPEPFNLLMATRLKHLSAIISVSYEHPLYVKKAAFQYMYDAYGNTILDAYNNIPHVGHSHPKVVRAGQRQLAKLNTNTRYIYNSLGRYAEKLLAKFPESLNKVFFVNSGSEASDLAIRIARKHTGFSKLMVVEHGYHGHTQAGIDISDYKFNNPKGQGQKSFILKAPIPDTYRGKFKNDDGTAGAAYAKNAVQQLAKSDEPIAAFIAEPIIGCGGQVPLAKGYLPPLYQAIRQQGGVCISDEVQTGFGRLGDVFWGFETQEVIPDLVIIGKPMGNGHPMGAVITTTEIAASFETGVEFFSSFGGNPVSCEIGLTVLDIIEEQHLQANAKDVGDYYKSLFLELKERFDCIGDVRGSGLFLGVEIVKSGTQEPDAALAKYIKNELRNRHILISTDGPHDSVLKTKPPLIFTKENAKTVVDTVEAVLRVNNKKATLN
jgi:4-aminobutyrate aminotransferase-like enzyme/Ser/Thr protein kinase RdoA (MazF antagonist)